MRSKLKAVIFDLDGVITDTSEYHYRAWKRLADEEDCAVVEDAEAGIEAALAGNMLSIGIGPEERAGKARYRFEKIGDVTLTKLLEIMNL